MKKHRKNNGVVFLMVIFAIALLTTITVGILIMSTEELLVDGQPVIRRTGNVHR